MFLQNKIEENQTISRDEVYIAVAAVCFASGACARLNRDFESIHGVQMSRFRKRKPVTTFDLYQSQDDERSTWTTKREWIYLQKWVEHIIKSVMYMLLILWKISLTPWFTRDPSQNCTRLVLNPRLTHFRFRAVLQTSRSDGSSLRRGLDSS